jgi:cytochrome b561
MILNSRDEWGAFAKTLHWLMAVLILSMFVLGWVAVIYPLSPTKLELFIWHKSIGLTLLALVVVRLLWRIVNITPEPPAGESVVEQRLARTGHAVLYALMVLMPVSGYIINSTANFSFRYFGGARVPNLIPADKAWQDAAEAVHLTTFSIFFLVVIIHIVAAIRHHTIKKNNILSRMLPG